MRGILLVAGKDLRTYLDSWWGWVIASAFLFIEGVAFMAWAVGSQSRASTEVLQNFLWNSGGIAMVASLFLTMRLFAEERSAGTAVLLEGSPLSSAQVVAGKYLSALGFLALMLGLSVYLPGLIFLNGKVSLSHIGVGYLGVFLLAAATGAIGTFTSSLVKSQVVAAITGGVIVAVFWLSWLLARRVDPPFNDVVAYMSFWDKHFIPFMRGRIETGSLVFWASVSWVFLLATTWSLENRRWQ